MRATKIKTCYLHIGSGKTGTSSIQGQLFRNRSNLLKEKVFYPNNAANHIFFATHFREDPTTIAFHRKEGRSTRAQIEDWTREQMEMLEADLAAFEGDTLIFSSEYFPPTSAEGCQKMAAYLAEFCEETKVVCYVRHPLKHAVSAAQQAVKMGFKTLEEAQRDTHFFSPKKILPKFAAAFGADNIIVRPFEREQLKGSDSLVDFCSVTSLENRWQPPEVKEEKNTSLSMEAVWIADSINKLFPREKNGYWNPDRAFEIKLNDIPGARFSLEPETLARLETEIAPDLAYLQDEFGISYRGTTVGAAPLDHKPESETLLGIATAINRLALERQHLVAATFFQEWKNAPETGEVNLPDLAKAFRLDPRNTQIFNAYHNLLLGAGKETRAAEVQAHHAAVTS